MTSLLRRALPVVFLLLTPACLQSRPEVPKPECEVDSECESESGKVCGPGGRCSDACKAEADCAAPRTCAAGACTLPAGLCERAQDCATDEVCSVGNRCAKACVLATQCAATEACVGGACTSLASGACRFNSECAAPQACVQGRCAEACREDRDCPFGTTCQAELCVPPAPGCLDATDCQAMQACSPQGDCVVACTSSSQCAATGEACSNGACVHVGADTAALTGSVVLTGVIDASNLIVSVEGPNRATGRTTLNGAFSFQGLLPGLYRVTVSAAGTTEGTATREAAARANATTPVPAFTLTPAGDVTGTVRLAGRTAHEGVQIVALSTGRGTVTAPDGTFTLRQLPVGSYDLLVAYTGYQAGQLSSIAVSYAQSTATTPLTLQPVPSGSTFAFSSLPPSSTPIDRPFTYQAVAGGGGVAAVTYALVDGPPSMTLNANTGQLSWQPTDIGEAWIVLSSTGGGATVYQLFMLSVEVAATRVFDGDVERLVAVDGGAWVINSGALTFVSNAGAATVMAPVVNHSGTITSLEHLNGRVVSGFSFAGGTLSAVRGPIGTLNGTWEGGVVGAVAGVDVRSVQSVTLLGGTSGTASAPTGDTISAVSWPTGPITRIDDGRSSATGFRANTGMLSTITSTGFTDAAGTWAADAFAGQCVMNAAGTARITITSHTATAFVLAANPTSVLTAGQRYFVGPCSGAFTTSFTFVDANRTSTPAASGRQIDLYAGGAWVGNFALTATTAPPNSTLSFSANVSQYTALQNAAATGFYTVALNAGLDVIVTDSTAPWTTATHSSSNFLYDDFAQGFDIVASTPTTLTVRQGFGTLVRDRTGRGWVLADTGNNVQVWVTLTTGGLTPGAAINQYLWIDARGEAFSIVSNTANTVTLDLPFSRFPLLGLVGGLVGRSDGTNQVPGLTVPTVGLTAGAHAGRFAVRLTNGSTPFLVDGDQLILGNGATSFDLDSGSCTGCVDGLAQRITDYSNVAWAPGSSGRKVDFRVTLSGSPNFAPESLRGRFVALESNRAATGAILHNDANSMVVEVDEAWFAAFRGLTSGDRLWLSEAPSSTTSPLKVLLTGQGAAWTPNEWVGASVIAPNSAVAGVVTANTATELELTITNTTAFLTLSAGANFAFARAHVQGLGCPTPGVWIRTQFTLPGATLTANAYTHLRSEFSSGAAGRLALSSNTTTGATAYVCGNTFTNLIAMMGRAAAFDTNGRFNLVVEDATAAHAVNAHAGQYLYLNGSNGGRFRLPINSNTATSFSINGIDSSQWFFNNFPYRATQAGTKYVITDASSQATVTATVTPALNPGELAGRWVRANDVNANTTSFGADLLVGQNTANTLTLVDVDPTTLDKLRNTGTLALRHLTLSRGTALRVTDTSANLPPGALVGRLLRLSNTWFVITENTATTLTARSAVADAFGNAANATTWSVAETGWDDELSARPLGGVVALRNDGRIASVTQGGAVTWITPFTGAQKLTVRTSPLLSGVLANAGSSGAYSTTWNDSAWSFPPDSLMHSYLRVRECSTLQSNFLIRENTATSVTGYSQQSCGNIAAGWRYTIDPARLIVSGTTLTPSALRGARLWMNGYEYLVRDNTATEVHLIYPEDYRVGPLLDVIEAGGTAYVLSGVNPNSQCASVGADGETGVWGGASAFAVRFDGSTWARVDGVSATTRLHSGSVSFASANNTLVDTAGGMTPGALSGKKLVVHGATFTISNNTSNSITIGTPFWNLLVPTPGARFEVYEADGFTSPQAFIVSGATTWLGAGNGLYKRVGTTWTRFSVLSTESAQGARDGLLTDDAERLSLLPNGDLYVYSTYSGVSRLRGTAWESYTVTNTESAPGLRDGLPEDDVYDVTSEASGAVWFATGDGAARLTGTNTWRVYGPEQGLDGYTPGVWIDSMGQVHLGTQTGLYRITP